MKIDWFFFVCESTCKVTFIRHPAAWSRTVSGAIVDLPEEFEPFS